MPFLLGGAWLALCGLWTLISYLCERSLPQSLEGLARE
jgi:hypothetical protein